MTYLFPPAPVVTTGVLGSDALFPVHRVYCVGRNYCEHGIEMGGNPDKEPPFFFQKNPENVIGPGTAFPYPAKTANCHHEVELVVALGTGGRDIPVDTALDHVFGYAVGIDMTRRDLQNEAKEMRRPWETSKAFEFSAPTSKLVTAESIGHPSSGQISLDVNGTLRQRGDIADMIWNVPQIISHLSGFFALKPGDLIFTGTPAGVGAVVKGDRMHAHIDGVADLTVMVV